jgi:hypothetical protein
MATNLDIKYLLPFNDFIDFATKNNWKELSTRHRESISTDNINHTDIYSSFLLPSGRLVHIISRDDKITSVINSEEAG